MPLVISHFRGAPPSPFAWDTAPRSISTSFQSNSIPKASSGNFLDSRDSEPIQLAPNTLTCRVDRNGPILISFFEGLGLGQVYPSEATSPEVIHVASLLDFSGTKAVVLQKRAEIKDYLNIAAILQHGVQLPSILAAGRVICGRKFNSLIILKALSCFDDLPALPTSCLMRCLPETPELLKVAARVVWFTTPVEALTDPIHFLAHGMTYGTLEDLHTASQFLGPEDFLEVLENASPRHFRPPFLGILESKVRPLSSTAFARTAIGSDRNGARSLKANANFLMLTNELNAPSPV